MAAVQVDCVDGVVLLPLPVSEAARSRRVVANLSAQKISAQSSHQPTTRCTGGSPSRRLTWTLARTMVEILISFTQVIIR